MRLSCLVVLALSGCSVNVVNNSCSDGILNGSESDVDCGGSCGLCFIGERCLRNSDCASNTCSTGGACIAQVVTGLPSSAGADVYTIDSGAALAISPGTQAGYGITANVGGSYRLVWTGDAGASGTYRQFTGTVWTSATFDSFVGSCSDGSCPLESDDSVSQPTSVTGGQRIDFDAIAATGVDGFDFSVTGGAATVVYFELLIDGTHRPDLVFFSAGGQLAIAGTDPFGLGM